MASNDGEEASTASTNGKKSETAVLIAEVLVIEVLMRINPTNPTDSLFSQSQNVQWGVQ